jgi:hypothetical protein
MKRKRILVLPGIIGAAIVILIVLLQILGAQSVSAETDATDAVVWGDPHVGFVINTTSGMQPEINAINAAWAQTLSWSGCLTCIDFHLTLFRDVAQYVGNTQDKDQFGTWLGELNAAGGGDCEDNTFAGLREFALNVPDDAAPVSDAIVFSDSPPMGNRRAFGFILDKMIENNIRVHNVGSALCSNENIPDYAMNYFSLLTGGEFHTPASPSDYVTDTLMAMNLAMSKDVLATYMGHVDNSVETFPLPVDSSVTTLGVEHHIWCLTCTQFINNQFFAFAPINGITVELIDPDGKVVDESTPGYLRFTSESRDMQIMFETLTHEDAGEWQVRVSGTGEFSVSVFGDSEVHMKSFGQHVARANKPFDVRAVITPEFDEVVGIQNVECHNYPCEPLTATLKLVGVDHFATVPIDMFNIGMPPNVYGGSATVPTPGLYRLVAEGTLEDGTKFTRVDPTPIRVRSHGMSGSGDAPALPGSTHTVSFELINDGVGGFSGPSTATTFDLELFSEQGWANSDAIPETVTLDPGQSVVYSVDVVIPANADIGLVEQSTLVAVPQDDLAATVSNSAKTTVVDQLNIYLPIILK